VINFFNVMH